MIPFFDLNRQYEDIKEELKAVQEEVFNAGNFIHGQQVMEFEKSFAGYIGAKHCISCGNGTDALELVLKAWNIGAGDEVIVPAFTWVSDAEAVRNVGATPVFVDIEPDYFGLDPEKIKEAITPSCKVIIAVHLFGHACLIDTILDIAAKHDLLVLEDVAQSTGATTRDRKLGSLGDAAIFSFYPTKNLGAYGDAGAILTDDEKLATKIKLLANHGQDRRDEHELAGRNSRLDELHAAYLNVKLKYLDRWNEKRGKNARYYNDHLDDNFLKPGSLEDCYHVYHQYVIRHANRDEIKKKLEASGIGSAIHYPRPIPGMTPFLEKDWEKRFPVARNISETILSLPVFPELEEAELNQVVINLNKFT